MHSTDLPKTRLTSARRLLRAACLVTLAPLALACESTGPQTGRLSVLLTDAPGDVRQAVVTISEVYLQGGAGEGEGGRVVLSSEETTTDLLTLADATRTLVDDAEIPAGRYAQLRFVITGGFVEVENADGSTSLYASSPDYAGLPAGAVVAGPLQMPSLAQSGLKVNLPGDAVVVEGGDATGLLVDFDVARSFGHAAATGWVMHPVLTATMYTPAEEIPAP